MADRMSLALVLRTEAKAMPVSPSVLGKEHGAEGKDMWPQEQDSAHSFIIWAHLFL